MVKGNLNTIPTLLWISCYNTYPVPDYKHKQLFYLQENSLKHFKFEHDTHKSSNPKIIKKNSHQKSFHSKKFLENNCISSPNVPMVPFCFCSALIAHNPLSNGNIRDNKTSPVPPLDISQRDIV